MNQHKMKVFISYQRANEKHLRTLLDLFKPYKDQYIPRHRHDFPAGDLWQTNEEKEIKEADVVILLLSGQYIDSKHCQHEASFTKGAGKKIIPVVISYFSPSLIDSFALGAQMVQLDECDGSIYVTECEDKEAAWKRLFDKIITELDKITRSTNPAPTTSSTSSPRRPRVIHSFPYDHLEQGWLTPFIGPMCYAELDNCDSAVDVLTGNLARLCCLLNDSDDKKYLSSVIHLKLPRANINLDGQSFNISTPDKHDSLTNLQSQLVKIGSCFCKLFGEAMIEEVTGCTDAIGYKCYVPSETRIQNLREKLTNLRDLLYEACNTAKRLAHEETDVPSNPEKPWLRSDGIHRQIVLFTRGLIYSQPFRDFKLDIDESTRQWENNHKSVKYDRDIQRDLILSVRAMEWLGSLLWHTLSYNLPMFPDNHTLAFHLSLCVEGGIPSIARYRSAASATSSYADSCIKNILNKALCRILKVQPYPDTRGFHGAMAVCLCQADVKKTSYDGVSSELEGFGWPYLPIAVTVNLDTEIERVLEFCHKDHHVLFPVNFPGLPSNKKQGWLLSSWIWQKEENCPKLRWYHVPSDISPLKIHKFLNGPLIIKTAGSPLHKLPLKGEIYSISETGACIKTDLEVSHRIILTDYEYIRSIIGSTRIPEWTKLLLQDDKRLLVFLGYSMNDPDDVFYFHGDAGLTTCEKRPNWQLLVDYPEDVFSHADLEKIDITLYEKNLEEFVCDIHKNAHV